MVSKFICNKNGKLLTLEQAKSNIYDFIKSWIKSPIKDKDSFFSSWIREKYPKQQESLTTKLILSITNHSTQSQEVKLLGRI